MKPFPLSDSYWDFARSVCNKRRYLLEAETRDFLRAIRRTAERRIDVFPAKAYLWRAQLGASTIELPIDGTAQTVLADYPYPTERMKPLPNRATEGRANPKGIPFLYVSTHRDTATAEVRPWKAGVVSVGQFKPVRDLRIVNTTLESRQAMYLGRQPNAKKREEAVWGDIDHAFSAPTTPTDNAAEYVPTQVLAELFRESGFDGVGYRSAYGPGHNIVLFDLSLADHINCMLVSVLDIQFDFKLEEQFSYEVKSSTHTT
jgi:hypothetical protein